MSKLLNSAAHAAIAATIASAGALAPSPADAAVTDQQINNLDPNPIISAESLRAKLAEYKNQMASTAPASKVKTIPLPAPKTDGLPPDAAKRFSDAFDKIRNQQANGPAVSGAAMSMPFNVEDATEALNYLDKKTAHSVTLTASDGRKYNIVSADAAVTRYSKSKVMTMDQAFAEQAASDNRTSTLVQRPAGSERYTGNATNVGGNVTQPAFERGDQTSNQPKRRAIMKDGKMLCITTEETCPGQSR
jgi:hypothetical protein